MKTLFIFVAGTLAAACVFLGGMIAFGTAAPPPPLASISQPFETADFSSLPPAQFLHARSGGSIAFRQWKTKGADSSKIVAVLIHGSASLSSSLHLLAEMLSTHGIEVYAPDIRGHGLTGQRGDIDGEGQLDEDLDDLAAYILPRHPGVRPVLAGFSAGGGFVLHAAATQTASKFERAILISPMLGHDAPTVHEGGDSWAKPFLPRIVALTLLNRLGVREFNYLTVIKFAVSPKRAEFLAPAYSYRLLFAFGTSDYAADLSKSLIPLQVLVGGNDELFYAARFEPAIHAVRPDIPVTVVPGVDHIGMVTSRDGMEAVLAAIKPPA
jgi:alpha-beta hydrolase superfamily lysophospholipase